MKDSRFEVPFDGLNPEDRAVAETVKASMNEWIDERVKQLVTDLKQQLDNATVDLNREINDMEKELAESAAEFSELLQNFNKVAGEIETGDEELLSEAIKKTRVSMEALQTELKAREKRWKSLGISVIGRAKALAAKAIGL